MEKNSIVEMYLRDRRSTVEDVHEAFAVDPLLQGTSQPPSEEKRKYVSLPVGLG